MIRTIISGGQVGVDRAALRAAKRLGLATGGWMPRSFRTLEGPRPEYATEYGVRETSSEGYQHRTRNNVRDSDGTLCIGNRWASPGMRLTVKTIQAYGKPSIMIHGGMDIEEASLDVAGFIIQNNIAVLNVAGNSDPNLEPFTEALITATVARLAHDLPTADE